MRAVVVDPIVANAMAFAEVSEPTAGRSQVVLDVHHVSLNHGDLNDAQSGRLPAGAVLGSDVAGVVIQEAADGSGPASGTRVVALAQGAFAERTAVDVNALAAVPDSVDLARMTAVPVAGLAALRALRAAGPILGKRVLVTGASGGVGHFALQLARYAGARVIASVGSEDRRAQLTRADADEVAVGVHGIVPPVDVVLDTVGGQQMVQAWQLLAPGGTLESIGWASSEPAVFPPYSTVGPAKSLHAFLNEPPYSADLAVLAQLAGNGALTPRIGWRGPFERVADAVEALRTRSGQGKTVLDLRAP